MAVNKERVALLVEALKSGDYEQGTGYLNKDGKYCCLGVACEVAIANGLAISREEGTLWTDSIIVAYDHERAYLPTSVAFWYGFTNKTIFDEEYPNANPYIETPQGGEMMTATDANDRHRLSLAEIGEGFRAMYLTGDSDRTDELSAGDAGGASRTNACLRGHCARR